MAIQIPVIDAVGGIFKSLIGAIDDWHTSDEEKILAKGQIFSAQATLLTTVFEYEKDILKMQADVIQSEAKSDHWITSAWRPITMLSFVGLVIARWFGLTAPGISPELEAQLMTLIQIGLGGYVVGRSAEKVAKSINYKPTIADDIK